MYYKWLALALTTLFVHITAAEPKSLANLEAEPSSFVYGCVNAITGNYTESHADLIIPGIEPLAIQRHYSSTDELGLWNFNHLSKLDVLNDEEYENLAFTDEHGSLLYFKEHRKILDDDPNTLQIDPDCLKRGVTNCASGEISGRTNHKNTYFDASRGGRERKYVGKTGAGTEYEFDKDHYHKQVKKITKVNQHTIKYSNKTKKIRNVAVANTKGDEVSSVDIEYADPSNADRPSKITSSDNRTIEYNYVDYKQRVKKFEVNPSFAPTITYNYDHHRDYQLIKKELPAGRYRAIDYHHHGKNAYRVKEIKEPLGPNGEEGSAFRFEYTINKEGKGPWESIRGGSTQAFDALNCKTTYHYSDEHRLTCIEKFKGKGESGHSLYCREKLYWGDEGSSNSSYLMGRSFEDHQKNIIFYREYTYDKKGNIRFNYLYGNLTGRDYKGITVKGNEKPQGEESDCYTIEYKYSDDNRNLILKEKHPRYRIEYNYKEGTDLLCSKFIFTNGVIQQRFFYEYDDNGALIKEVVDDGKTTDIKEMDDCTERKVKIIKNTHKNPSGMPEVIEEFYLDLKTRTRVLIHKTVNKYSPQGQIKRQEHYGSDGALAYTLLWEYNAHGQVIKETDALGHVTLRDYDENGNKIREQGPNPDWHMEYTYDKMNRLLTQVWVDVRNKSQFVERYTYDGVGNKISSTDRYGNTTTYDYDAFGRVKKIFFPALQQSDGQWVQPIVTQEYDHMGNVKKVINPRGETTQTYYTVLGKPYHIQYPDGSEEKMEYDKRGNLKMKIERNSSWTDFTNDYLGRVQTKNMYSAGALVASTTSIYNTFHMIQEIDTVRRETHYSYDGAGRLIKIVKGDRVTTLTYDTLGRTHETREWVDTEHYIAKVQLYDNLNRVVEERIEDDKGVVAHRIKYGYDLDGNRNQVTTFSQAGEATNITHYDMFKQPVEVRDALDYVTKTIYRNDVYNANGQLTPCAETTDPLGQVTRVQKDALGNGISYEKKDPHGTTLQKQEIRYNLSGKREQVTENVYSQGIWERQVVTHWYYDGVGRLERLVEAEGAPEQKVTAYTYNKAGLVEEIIQPDTVRLKHTYDSFNRLQTLTASDGSVSYEYVYDASLLLRRIVDHVQGGVTIKEYDVQDRLQKETLENGYSLTYGYDGMGRLKSVLMPDGSGVGYTYSPCRMKEVQRKNASGEIEYVHAYNSYDLSGHVTEAQMIGKAGMMNLAVDKVGRFSSLTTSHWKESILEYDAVGNMRQRSVEDNNGYVDCSYSYDGLYQLTGESGMVKHEYNHDSLFNRLKKDGSLQQINALNQLQDDCQSKFDYDANGRLKSRVEDGATTTYEYDALDRLIAVQRENVKYCYKYDGENRRLSKQCFVRAEGEWIAREKVDFLYQGNNEIGAYHADKQLRELRLLGSGKGGEVGAAVALEIAGKAYAVVHDHNGNVVCLIDSMTGREAASYRYSVFGEELFDDSLGNPWRFSSKRVDEETGWVFFGRRYYNPVVGRWMTPDPLGLDAGPNVYAYLLNNPLTHFDAYGLIDEDTNFVYRGLSAAGKGIGNFVSAIGRGIELIGRHAIAVPVVKDAFEGAGHVLSGKNPRDYVPSWRRPHSEILCTEGWEGDGYRVGAIFGNMVSREEALMRLNDIAIKFGGIRVYGVIADSKGFSTDSAEFILQRLGVRTNLVKVTESYFRMMREGVSECGTVIQINHSRGCQTCKSGSSVLTSEERRAFHVYNFGGAYIAEKDEYGKVMNFIANGDFIPIFTETKKYICAKINPDRYNVRFVENSGAWWCAHSYYSQHYQAPMDEVGYESQMRKRMEHN